MQIQIRKMKTHKSQLNPNEKRTQLNSWNKRRKNEEHEKQPLNQKKWKGFEQERIPANSKNNARAKMEEKETTIQQ